MMHYLLKVFTFAGIQVVEALIEMTQSVWFGVLKARAIISQSFHFSHVSSHVSQNIQSHRMLISMCNYV